MRTGRSRIVLFGVLLGLAVLGGVLVALQSLSEVVDKGHDLRPYESAIVHKVRIADAVTVYIDDESKRIGADLVSGFVLIALGTAAALTAWLLSTVRASRRLVLFYSLSALGLSLLAIDELGGIHESVGHTLPFLADLPGVERPDDAVFAVYLVLAAGFAFLFRDVIFGSPLSKRLFGFALMAFAVVAVFDLTGFVLDEPLEVLVALLVAAGLVTLMNEHLREHLRLDSAAPSAGRLF